jgi:hypothetical protein
VSLIIIDAPSQINHAHQEITDAGAVLDRPRLRALAHLAEARLEALSTGRTDGPTLAHVVAARDAWRAVHARAHRVLARTYHLPEEI